MVEAVEVQYISNRRNNDDNNDPNDDGDKTSLFKHICILSCAPSPTSHIHNNLDAMLCFGSMSWYRDTSEVVLYITSGSDSFGAKLLRSQTFA